ncbi:hypothetical protein SNEBB_000704 [Seison nebaliae]|nr:hypothetical protein SNEBB_000704 [Seison nebaliae]
MNLYNVNNIGDSSRTINGKHSDLFGQYYIGETIGSGGFAKVKCGQHIATNIDVAIKIMDKECLGDDLHRAKVEIETLMDLQHQHICRLLHVMETESRIYLIIEYCNGGELFDYIVQHDRLDEKETRKIFRQLISALSYIHAKGYAHRDIKPENILLDSERNVKLIDFGLCANPCGGLNANNLRTACGSPAYAAPELISGKEYNGSSIDMWSAGVLLYTVLCGYLPFDHENASRIYHKILNEDFDRPAHLSPNAIDLINRLLEKDPSKRLKMNEVIIHPFMTDDGNSSMEFHSVYDGQVSDDVFDYLSQLYKMSREEVKERVVDEKRIFQKARPTLNDNCLANITIEMDHESVNRRRIREHYNRNFSIIERRRLCTYAYSRALHFHANTSYFMSTFNILHMKMSLDKNYQLKFPTDIRRSIELFNNLRSIYHEGVGEVHLNKKQVPPEANLLLPNRFVTPTKYSQIEPDENREPLTPKKIEVFGDGTNSICTFYTPAIHSNKSSTKRRLGKAMNAMKNIIHWDLERTPTNGRNGHFIECNSTNKPSKQYFHQTTNELEQKKKPRKLRDTNNIVPINHNDNADDLNSKLLSIITSLHLDCSRCSYTTRIFIKDDWGKTVLAFDMEIVQLPNNYFGVKGKRVIGDIWNYKGTFKNIIQKLANVTS